MLHATPSLSIPDPRPAEVPDYRDVLSIIRRTERLEKLLPRVIMTVFVGLPILLGLAHGHPILGLINAFLLCFVGAYLCRVVAIVFLAPIHAVRYANVTQRLAATLDSLASEALTTAKWMANSPGALAITRLATVMLVDRSTDYRFISLADEEIIAVDVSIDEDVQMTSRNRPAFTLGSTFGRGIFGGWAFGGRTVTNARVMRSHHVILRYQREEDPIVRWTRIPFGPDGVGAGNLQIALDRVRNAASG